MGGGGTISNESPRVDALQISRSTYGAVIPVIFGTCRVTINCIDYIDFTAIPHTTTQGGKGGSNKVTNTDYTYEVVLDLSICEGQINSIGTVWKNNEKLTLAALGMDLYFNQQYGYMVTYHPERALYYRNTSRLAGKIDLGSTPNLPNLLLEVITNGRFGELPDVNPKDVITELITNDYWGAAVGADVIYDLTNYSNYCIANGLFLSVNLEEQKKANEIITDICMMTNSQPFMSQGKIKFVPYGDETVSGNGATYVPPNDGKALYELDEDDFIVDEEGDEPPIILIRDNSADSFNVQQVEFINREKDYAVDIAEYSDMAAIEMSKRTIPASVISAHFIHDRQIAHKVCQIILNRKLYNKNKYRFKLGWMYYLLEPMDYLSLNYAGLGLNKTKVQIIEIEEDKDTGALSFLVEECSPGTKNVVVYPLEDADPTPVNFNNDPGNTVATIFNPSPEITKNELEAWFALSGGIDWGGCSIWLSDNDIHYQQIGTVDNPARQGTLLQELPAGLALDTVNNLMVELVSGQLLSGTQQDAENLNTLCWVGGELIAYATSTLIGTKQYSLSYLIRGVYNTPITSHAQGSKFVRLDPWLFKFPFRAEQVGKEVYIKFTSRNQFGAMEQPIDTIEPVVCILDAKNPPDVTGITLEEVVYKSRDGVELSDIKVTFEAPVYLALDCYKIFYSIEDGDYQFHAITLDKSSIIKALPQTENIKVKIITVSLSGLESAGLISDVISIVGDNLPPAAPSNLAFNWDSYDLKVFWDQVYQNVDSTVAADIKDYLVEVWVSGVKKRSEYVASNIYTYSLSKNILDNINPVAAVTVNVYTRDFSDSLSTVVSAVCTSQIPNIPNVNLSVAVAQIILSANLTIPQLQKFAKIQVKASETTGFNPNTEGELLHDSPSTVFIHAVNSGSTWFYRVRVVDKLGQFSLWSDQLTGVSTEIDVEEMLNQVLRMGTTSGVIPAAGTLANLHDGSEITTAQFNEATWIEDKFVGQQFFSTFRITVLTAVNIYVQYFNDISQTWVDCAGSAAVPLVTEAGRNVFQMTPVVVATKLRVQLLSACTLKEIRFGTIGQIDDLYADKIKAGMVEALALKIGVDVQTEYQNDDGSVIIDSQGLRIFKSEVEVFSATSAGAVSINSLDGKTKFTGTAWEIRDESDVLRVKIGKLD